MGITISTVRLDEAIKKLEPQRRWGTAYFPVESKLQLTFRDGGQKLLLDVKDKLVLGRKHNGLSIEQPDIDLSPFNALEKGVSRRHALLARDQHTIVISDLASANSTYLNGQRLMPYEPRILRDADELRFGHLVITVAYV